MYKKILLLISILTIAQLNSYSKELTLQDISNIVSTECNKFNASCTLSVNLQDSSINAYTLANNNILISKGMIDTFTDKELLAVVLHEVGHCKASDYELLQHVRKYSPELLTSKKFRHNIEYKADEYASKYFIDRCEHNYLLDAFERLYTLKANTEMESNTHPAVKARIEGIKKLNVNNCKIYNFIT